MQCRNLNLCICFQKFSLCSTLNCSPHFLNLYFQNLKKWWSGSCLTYCIWKISRWTIFLSHWIEWPLTYMFSFRSMGSLWKVSFVSFHYSKNRISVYAISKKKNKGKEKKKNKLEITINQSEENLFPSKNQKHLMRVKQTAGC